MIKCIVVDDEPLAVQLLSSYVTKVEHLDLISSFTNPIEALSYLNEHLVDLIFLDVQMPELNGVQFAKIISKETSVIFTTAYSEYAVDGFELNAVDYLVKPITFHRFLEAVNRVTTSPKSVTPSTQESKREFIMVKTENRHQKINYASILYLKGMGDYVAIHTTDGRIMTLENMKSFEKNLPPDLFIRVHKSYIISIDKIKFIERSRIGIEDELIPISATYQDRFWERMNEA